MEPIKVDFTGGNGGKGKGSGKDAYLSPSKAGLKTAISIVGTIIGAAIAYYFMLPALNFKSTELYFFVGIVAVIYLALQVLLSGVILKPEYTKYVKKQSIVPGIIIGVLAVVVGVGMLFSSVVFRASSYSKIISVSEDKTFSSDIKQADFKSVPVLDTAASAALATRTLGDLASINKESQFEVASQFTQINYKNSPVRVGTLAYGDIFKWFKNTKEGMPGYIIVDMVTQKTEFVMLKEGNYIRYSTEEHFSKYLMRHVRFAYPTYIFDEPHFEIDEEGRPFWLCPVLDKTIGLFGGTDVKGAIITDALTGESQYYSMGQIRTDDSLNWIDVVYNENLVVQQYNYHGKLSHGFWNSIIFQNDVNVTSDGSGVIAMDDDVWVYTGVTSAEADTSNFGFILCNQRTKELRYYKNGGAQESSAQASAVDMVQQYRYQATFPILLDIEDQPTYFMSLYGDGYTVKGYALVNLDDKTIVGTGLLDNEKSHSNALNAAVENYISALKDKNKVDQDANADDYKVDDSSSNTVVDGDNASADSTTEQPQEEQKLTVIGEVKDIKTSVNDGNTVYYLQVKGKYYYITVTDCMDVLLINKGDKVKVTYTKDSDKFVLATDVEVVK